MFARLKVPSPDGSGSVVDHGVHAIVVPLRDADGKTLPGIEIKDCGYKVMTHKRLFVSKMHESAIVGGVLCLKR